MKTASEMRVESSVGEARAIASALQAYLQDTDQRVTAAAAAGYRSVVVYHSRLALTVISFTRAKAAYIAALRELGYQFRQENSTENHFSVEISW
jgi:hypothetical protein